MLSNKSKIHSNFFNFRKGSESRAILNALGSFYAQNSGRWANELLQLVNTSDFKGLCNFSLELFYNDDPLAIRMARQCLALYQKNIDIDIQVNRDAVAWESFAKSEFLCKQTNDRFRHYWSTLNSKSSYEEILYLVRRKIANILGACPSLAELHLGFGPGSSTTVKRKTSSRFKLDASPVCSKEAIGSLTDLWAEIPNYAYLHKGKARVGYGELTFVPKNAKTNRSIIIEPLLNTFVQKGYGDYIKRRLLLSGCNLYDQSVNQELARLGSIFDNIATLDLSSASDTLASALVVDLLPMDWVAALSNWRTGAIIYKDKSGLTIEQNKFSSMGNGFTFELESLIFFCIAFVVTECLGEDTKLVSTYGDDIIVPKGAANLTCSVLEECGFILNNEKSYFSGSFRESCGADFFRGENVRPFYVKDRFTSARIVGLLNFYFDDFTMLPAEMRDYLITLLPKEHVLRGPAEFGDGHIHSYDWEYELKPHIHNSKSDNPHRPQGWRLFYFSTFIKRTAVHKNWNLSIGDSLLPSYETYKKSFSQDKLQKRVFRKFVFNSGPYSKRKCLEILGDFVCDEFSARETDPYAVSGGKTCKKTKICILS